MRNIKPPIIPPETPSPTITEYWKNPAVIAPNNFVHKSLSCWAYNTAVGCTHGCRFCYVPNTSTIQMSRQVAEYGVSDPDLEWGQYVLLRPWDETKFLSSLASAEKTPPHELNADGNRAIICCSTTDPYQSFFHEDPVRRCKFMQDAEYLITRALELIRDKSTLNVRILTRSPLARRDFDLFGSFGPRLMFGMSVPTLRNDLARIYEPNAPAPSQRLATLKAAKNAGLNVYVAVAPTYPDSNDSDLAATLKAVAELRPSTVFMEPINIRAENVQRIAQHAASLGVSLRTEVFATPEAWQQYAIAALKTVEALAEEYGLANRLHLWPDKALGTKLALSRMADSEAHLRWLQSKWSRISEWP